MRRTQEQQNRLALKGFEWIQDEVRCTPVTTPKDKSFKNFKVLVEKKKWKKKSYKTFEGFEERIKKVLQNRLQKSKDQFVKEHRNIFLKRIEYLRAKNQINKVKKMKQVENIRRQEAEFTTNKIENYLQSEKEWAQIHLTYNGNNKVL